LRTIVIFTFLLLGINLSAQEISKDAKFYLMTCNEGDMVFEQFGHTGLRVYDPINQIDLVFNWGYFSFGDDPNAFMMKFAKGKLDYELAIGNSNGFFGTYQHYNRTVWQSELDLNEVQKHKLWNQLKDNWKEENRGYRYDFFLKNCATIVYDHINEATDGDLDLMTVDPDIQRTYRDYINIGFNDHPWTRFGINLVLGSPIDQKVDEQGMMFHPLYVDTLFMNSKFLSDGRPLIKERIVVFEGKKHTNENTAFLTPTKVTLFFLILSLVIGFFQWILAIRIFAGLYLFIISILGFLLLFMWFGTDHQTAANNYNLLWANPIILIFAVGVLKKDWMIKLSNVFYYTAGYFFFFILFFMMLPQIFTMPIKIIIMTEAFLFYFLHRRANVLAKQ